MSGRKKAYNNTFETQIAIWNVLARYSSREKPLSIADICKLLGSDADAEGVPSANTVRRYLSGEKAALDAVSPTHTLLARDAPGASHAYVHKDALHVVLENREGLTEWEGDMAAVFEAVAPIEPRYSTIANLLGSYPMDSMALPPVRLKCVVARSGKSGKTSYIPYQTWADEFEDDNDRPKNKTRYYYLESVLSTAEWKILADAVKVYPYITAKQTKKLLSALKRMNPGKDGGTYYLDDRYAFKREKNESFFKTVDILDAAVRERRTVIVNYGEYVLERSDGRWEPVLRKRENRNDPYGNWKLEPYDLMWSNGYYYLVGRNAHYGWMNLRVDRILSAVPQEERFERMSTFSPAEYRDRSPVMYPGEERHVRLRCDLGMVNTLLDFFGAKPEFRQPKDDRVEVTMNVAPKGVKLFAMQYADRVEVLEPKELREEVRDSLRAALGSYQ